MKKPWYKDSAVIGSIITGACIIIGALISIGYFSPSAVSTPKTVISQSTRTTTNVEQNKLNLSITATQTTSIKVLAGISIETIPVKAMSDKNIRDIINQIRVRNNLRELTALESGKDLFKMPTNTFGFLSAIFLDANTENGDNLRGVINRYYNSRHIDFEIHRQQDNNLYLITFISNEAAAHIAQLDGVNKKEFVSMPYALQSSDHVAIIPINRIIYAKWRAIDADNNVRMYVGDVTLR